MSIAGVNLFSRLRPASAELLNLDFLRFVASSGIVAYHSIEFFVPKAYREALNEQTRGLSLFVDLFFVISGFVITYVYCGKIGSLPDFGRFMQRRIGRLVPLHLLTLIVSIVIIGSAAAVGQTINRMPSFEPRCIAQTAVFLHAIVSCGNGIYFNGVSWSIGAEMVMYLLFPLLVWVGYRTRTGLLVATVAALLVVAAAHQVEGGAWELLPPVPRALPSFLIGISLFYWKDVLRRIPRPGLIQAVCLPVTVVAMTTGVPDIVSLVLVYALAGSAIAADVQGSVGSVVKRLAPLGQLTYSIYMWHSILITVLMNGIGDKVLHAGSGPMIVIGALCYAGIFAVSCISYLFIETPARRWIDGLALFPPTRSGTRTKLSAR